MIFTLTLTLLGKVEFLYHALFMIASVQCLILFVTTGTKDGTGPGCEELIRFVMEPPLGFNQKGKAIFLMERIFCVSC